VSDDKPDDERLRHIDMSPRYRYIKEKSGASGGGGIGGDGPKTVTLQDWEIGVVLVALGHELKELIRSGPDDDGLVEYIKILSGVIMRLEEPHGGPA
jgi:hypothetical protein